MQDPILLAFRKRLKKRGYTNISIYQTDSITGEKGYYRVDCNEPLANTRISAVYPLATFHKLMR